MYDISDAKLSKNGPYYEYVYSPLIVSTTFLLFRSLDIPGLAENRPSVMVGKCHSLQYLYYGFT